MDLKKNLSLPDLPYEYDALEPAISGEIMRLHHQKHHQAYVTNFNNALHQLSAALAKGDASAVVVLQSALKFNGGAEKMANLHDNFLSKKCLFVHNEEINPCFHSFVRAHKSLDFWKNLAPVSEGGGKPPKGSLGSAIDEQFGSLEALVQKMNRQGAALQGSGWVWLALDKKSKRISVETTANQDPIVTKGPTLVPLLGIDVWEHAYYLQYKNVRPDYLKNIWKVMNWNYASEVYERECP